MNQEAKTNLDEDLRAARGAKYANGALQEDVRMWLATVLGKTPDSGDLLAYLKDGTRLCQVVNAVWGANSVRYKESRMAFVQMENIDTFLRFAKAHGVAQDELFQTVDLYESKDPYQVLMALQALSRAAHKHDPKWPLIGPAVAVKRTRPPVPAKPKTLVLGQGGVPWSSQEYGYMNGANQATEGVVFGGVKKVDRS